MVAFINCVPKVSLLILATIKMKVIAFLSKPTALISSHNSAFQSFPTPIELRLRSSDNLDEIKISEERYDADACSNLRSMTFKKLDRSTEPQLLSDFLMELGACSVSITDHDRDTDLESPIFHEPSDRLYDGEEEADIDNMFAAIICGDFAVGKNVWLRCDVTALFPATVDLRHVADQVRYTFDMATMPRYQVDDIPDRDWVMHVQSSWKPCIASGFVLKFPWHDDEDVLEAIDDYFSEVEGEGCLGKLGGDVDNYTQLQLEGGVAFGTGEHPTTQLCLDWIRNTHTQYEGEINLFLDYGSGSGVLGLAACALSKNRIQSVGVEIDPDAIRIADYNADVNQLNMRAYFPSSLGECDESASLIMKAMHRTKVDVLPEFLDGQRYDACAANILAGPLCSLVKTIAGLVKSGGHIGLSGILTYQADDVIKAYSVFFNEMKVQKKDSGWVLLTGTRK